MKKRGGLKMSPTSMNTLTKKHTDMEKKKAALRAGGSLKTKNKIDVQEICREVRGK